MKNWNRVFLGVLVFAFLVLPSPISTLHTARAAGPWLVATTGNDTNNCLTPSTPCASINGALAKPGFVDGDTIKVAVGTYYGTGSEVVLLNRSATLLGGWDAAFTSENGMSTIDGQAARRGVHVSGNVIATIERFDIRNGLSNQITPGDVYTDVGAGIYNYGTARLTINKSILTNNSAGFGGGGLYNINGTVELNNSTVSFNTAHNSGGGGGIVHAGGSMTITNSTIDNNIASGPYATGAGAGINAWAGNLAIINSTISNNVALDTGGGIVFSHGNMVIRNSTISGNRAQYGGGIAGGSWNNYVQISSSTLTNNVATGYEGGGGIRNIDGQFIIRNSIVAGNLHSFSPDCHGSTGSSTIAVTSGGYNLLRYTDACPFTSGTGDLLGYSPFLKPITGAPGYNPLRVGSPAIDAGNPSGCLDEIGDLLSTDQRGFQRVGRCDIGAYEFGGTPPPVGPYNAFFPLLQNSTTANQQSCSVGICGRVFENGRVASGIQLDLRFYNGSTWTTIASASTNWNGDYSFTGVPSLTFGQGYYVRFLNNSNNGRLSSWSTRTLTAYIASSNIPIGDFDIANIALVPPGGTAALPRTFRWTPRTASPSDTYEFNLFHPTDFNPYWWSDPSLSYVDNYVLWTLFPGFNISTQYGWFMAVYSPDGGYGESFYYYIVVFSNPYTGGSPHQSTESQLKKIDAPTPNRFR